LFDQKFNNKFAAGIVDTGGKFAAGIVDSGGNLPPVSTTLAKLVEKFAAGVVDTAGNFAAGVVGSGGKFATGVVDTGGAPWLHEFSKKFETVLMEYSGAGGKMIHEKNQKQKISWHCPFKERKQMFSEGKEKLSQVSEEKENENARVFAYLKFCKQ
jgi:hypothetical protein